MHAVVGCSLGFLLLAWSPVVAHAADPAGNDPELQALLDEAGNFTPDPGEPRDAIKAHLLTQRDVHRAFRRIEVGRLPNEADFDPDALLTPALIVRREATAKYPTSRHAWEGLGDVLWWKYKARHKSSDLRESVDAYERASEIAMSLYDFAPKRFYSIIGAIAEGRAVLGDTVVLDAFFRKVKAKGGNWWEMSADHYAMALGKLNDSRAEPLWREVLTNAGPDVTSYAFVAYLLDRKRYQEALDVFDRAKPLGPIQHAERGAMLERLGRLTEAKAEYKPYFDEANKAPFGRLLSVPDRYRIPGSKLQSGINFKPDTSALPTPTS